MRKKKLFREGVGGGAGREGLDNLARTGVEQIYTAAAKIKKSLTLNNCTSNFFYNNLIN